MPNPLAIVGGASAIGGLLSGGRQADAAENAANAQAQASLAGIEEQRRQFDRVQELLAPFVTGGTAAFQGAMNLSGANGPTAERTAIREIMLGPQYNTAMDQGEASILSNASATGGLRGGNTQRAMGELAPTILNNIIAQRYSQLGGLAQMGQSSAAGVGNAAQTTGSNVASLLAQQGQAQAGGALGAAAGFNTALSGITSGLGTMMGANTGGLAIPAGQTAFSRWGF